MKELYTNTDMEVVEFAVEDVITTSPGEDIPTTTQKGGLGGENEGPAGDSFL